MMRADHLSSSTDPILQADPSVLVIEDDQDVAKTICRFVERAGMRTSWARNGAEAVRLKESFQPDIVLVDLELPDVNGVSLISWLAGQQDCGIIIVSGRGDEVERVVGIELGADDYITKPVPMRELVARIRAVHRRAARPARPVPAAEASGSVSLGSVRVDTARRLVLSQNAATGAEEPIHLTTAEYTALEAMIDSSPQPVSRETLCRLALRRPMQAEDRGVDQLILNLRRKLFDEDTAYSVIVSVRGAGYAVTAAREPATGQPARPAGFYRS